jgi:hypothetical protein
MVVKLTHPFLMECIDPKGLLRNNLKSKSMTFSMFSGRLRKQATKYATGGDGKVNEDKENKYKGNGFELFCEIFVRIFGFDMLVSINPDSYEIVADGDDTGVDGIGIGNNGKIHTLQAKFCIGTEELTANRQHLTNFTSASMLRYNVNKDEVCNLNRPGIKSKINMTIMHTGKGINHYTENDMLCGLIREIGLKDIKNKVDGNNIFWECFRKSWDKHLTELMKKKRNDEK